MAKTIISAFQKFKENIEITGLQLSTISTRQNNIRDVVESDIDVLDSFLIGSYKRSTMIAPLSESDIDIFIVLDPKYHTQLSSPASLLDKVRRTLLKTYTKTPKISRNGQAVSITFTDFMVDVVPAFYRNGGGYLIPDSINNEWISTDPTVHINLTSQENIKHNGDLVPLIKTIKCWNKNIGKAFVSFRLELLAIGILKGVTISDYSSGVRYFFDKGRELIKYKATDPVPYGGKISGLNNISTVEEAVSRFETAYNRAIKAEAYADTGEVELAINEWKKIFGNYFPSYN